MSVAQGGAGEAAAAPGPEPPADPGQVEQGQLVPAGGGQPVVAAAALVITGPEAILAAVDTPNVTMADVPIPAMVRLQKSPPWRFFRQWGIKCTLPCCKLTDFNAANMVVLDHSQPLCPTIPPGEARQMAQLKKQQKQYKDIFRKLVYIPPGDARLTLSLGAGPGSRDILYEPSSIHPVDEKMTW